MAYDLQSEYIKHLSDDCECPKGECTCNKTDDDCGCCPPGLVQVFDLCGKPAGCLTPNDAEEYNNGKLECPEGFVKTFHPVSGKYLGCLAPADAESLITLLTP